MVGTVKGLERILVNAGKKLQRVLLPAVAASAFSIAPYAKAQAPYYGNIVNVSSLNTTDVEVSPEISCDGTMMYYSTAGNPDDLMQATADEGEFTNIMPIPGVNTPDNAEQRPSVSCDGLKIAFTRWPIGSDPGNSADLWFGIRSDVAAPFAIAPLDSLNDPSNFEGEPIFFDNGARLAYDRSCNCGDDFRGIYEALLVGPGPADYVQQRKWDEFDELGIGRVGLGAVSRDGLRALINCFNCPGGTGDWDIIYADRDDVDARWNFRDADGNVQYLNINTPAVESGGSFINGTADIYFTSNRSDGTGSYDIWKAMSCTREPVEVSPAGSPHPLRISRDRGTGDITLSFAHTRGCESTNNLYIGAIVGFPNVTALSCHNPPVIDPSNPERRTLTLPMGRRNEFYLITESTLSAEGTSGFESNGNERGGIFNTCGPTP